MLMALAMNRVSFVRLFLKYGVSINTVLNQKNLEFLYGYCSKVHSYAYKFDEKHYKSSAHEHVIKLLCGYGNCSITASSIPVKVIIAAFKKLCSKFMRDGSEQFVQVTYFLRDKLVSVTS